MASEQPRRVRRPKDKEDLVQRLTEGKEAVFSTYRDLLIFSASLGYYHAEKKPFKATSEPIPWSYFMHTPGEQLVDMLTAANVSDPAALGASPELFNQRLELFEEYANGGLEVLQRELKESTAPPVEVIRTLLLSVEELTPGETHEPDLKEIAETLSL